MAVLTIHHYLDIIRSFINDVETQNSYYLWAGKPDSWLNPAGNPDDSSNNITTYHSANDSVYQHESSIYHDIIFGKKITPTYIEFLIPRINWVANTVYGNYDQFNSNLYSSNFYVVTDNLDVFKIIDNNNGAASKIKPTLTTQSGTFQTSDGYTWKYMYTIDSNANTLYTTTNYIAVRPNTAVIANATPGTIDVIRINNYGNGYPYYTGFLVASANNKSVIIDSSASYANDYYTNSSMYLKAGYGAGQIRKIVKYDGLNKIVTVDTAFNTFATFNITSITGPDTFTAGNILTQNVDNLAVLYTKGVFQVGDTIIQSDTGANATIVTANSTVLKVTRPAGVNAFSLGYAVYNASQSGTIKSGTVNITAGNNYVTSTNTAQTAFTTDFSVNDYIRVGGNANNNIRRVTAVNSSVIVTDNAFSSSAVANVIYNLPYAFEPSSITLTTANGLISNTNIYGVILGYSNKTNLSINYTTGEKVDMVDASNTSQGVSGIVSYSNTSTVVLSSVTGGSFSTSYYLRGESSLQRANITSVTSYPNITISNPLGTFISGIPVNTRDTNGNILGSANVLSYFTTPNQLTEYVISPTVNILGDGANALAYATVDTSNTSTGALTAVTVLNPGSGYTYANITITSNSFYGNGASVYGVVSPVTGHGSEPYSELGARYAGITMTFANGLNEGYKFPVYGTYRRIGIIKNPVYNNITVNLGSFDRARLSINTVSGSGFSTNEYILQANSGAVGKIVYANSSYIEIKEVQGTFSANLKFANGASSNDNILGLTSRTTANVATSNVVYFTKGNAVETVSEITSGANATIVATNSNTQLLLANVYGKFAVGDTLYDPVTNAYANVTSILIANGTIDVSNTFGTNFNQTLRFPLTSNSAPFQQFERVTQAYSNATGMIISNNNEQDVVYTSANGSFSAGDIVRNSVNTATGILTFANSTYLRITSVNGAFSATQTIINNLNVGATISNAYNVLVLSDIGGSGLFSSGSLSGNVTGSITGSTGKCNVIGNIIQYPDLVINTGEVTYLENISSPFQLSNTSKETVQIVIKF